MTDTPAVGSPARLRWCSRCEGHGWTGPGDRRPGVTCDDCNGTGFRDLPSAVR